MTRVDVGGGARRAPASRGRGRERPPSPWAAGTLAIADGRRVLASRRGRPGTRTVTTARRRGRRGRRRRRAARVGRARPEEGAAGGHRPAGEAAVRAALLALALLLAACAGAAAAPIVSLQDDNLVNVSGPALEARLDALAATGAKATRVDVLWREVAPARARPTRATRPTRPTTGAATTRSCAASRRAGSRPLLDFYLTPEWASRSGARGRPRRAPPTAPASPGRSRGATRARSPARAGRRCPRCAASRSGTSPTCPGFWMPQCRRGRGREGAAGLAARATPRCWRRPTARSRRRTRARSSSAAWPAPPGSSPTVVPDGRPRRGGEPRLRPAGGRRGPADRRLEHAHLPHRVAPAGLLRALLEHPARRSSGRWIGLLPARRST